MRKLLLASCAVAALGMGSAYALDVDPAQTAVDLTGQHANATTGAGGAGGNGGNGAPPTSTATTWG
jgi:hypothetical protein